jgi:hypothetical protein
MSGGLTRRSQIVYFLALENKYEDVVSYFLGMKVSIELWNFCKRTMQTLAIGELCKTPVVLSWETRAVSAGFLSQSMSGPMPGD